MQPQSSPVRLLLVENEPLAARLLGVLVRGLGYEPVGPAANADEALDLYRESLPPVDVALLDVGLDGDLDGVELAHELRRVRPLPIIFLTSLQDRATFHRAKLAQPAAYLLKPYDAAALEHALELALLNFAAHRPALLPAALLPPDEPEAEAALALPGWAEHDLLLGDCVFVRERGRITRVCLTDVQYAEAADKYTTLVTATARHSVRLSLRELALELPPRQFVQVHRGYVVNLRYLEGFAENQAFVLVAGATLPLSRSYRDALLQRLRVVG